ncbi:unnamed protein product [Polarella glacialis]|uniref:Thioesterase domain-containing protein n=1 Tax=Polarella glacialis TaxID=89957 RepID=A0A813DA48_POLGL|nr:unnamed protein product [Polarella glacialis]
MVSLKLLGLSRNLCRRSFSASRPGWVRQIQASEQLRRIDPTQTLLQEHPQYASRLEQEHFTYGTLVNCLKLDPFYDDEQRVLWTVVSFGSGLENVHGTLHGGAISTVFDATFSVLCAAAGVHGTTANLSVDFRRPVRIPSDLLVKCSITDIQNRKVFMEAELLASQDSDDISLLIAESKSLFITKRPPEH